MAAAAALFGRGHLFRPRQSDAFPADVSGLARPIDGDSLWVGFHEVRLEGIDAPEGRQTCERGGAIWYCGEAARTELVRAIGNDSVTCEISERDVYGRLLGRCAAGGRDLNSGMVLSGLAVAYGGYRSEEAKAKSEKRGIWAGQFDAPRKWRAEHASQETR